jgi:hypothetical protein
VSLYRAVSTGRYHSTDGRWNAPRLSTIQPVSTEWIGHILQIENDNFRLPCRRNLPCRFLRHEDILEAFGFPLLGRALRGDEISSAAAKLKRMADEWNFEAEERFRQKEPEFVGRFHSSEEEGIVPYERIILRVPSNQMLGRSDHLVRFRCDMLPFTPVLRVRRHVQSVTPNRDMDEQCQG